LKQKGTEKIQGKSDAAPPALPARAQQPVITGFLLTLYYYRLFVKTFYNKAFSKSLKFLRVVQRTAGAVPR
jgi:hypothetical protein